MDITPAHLITGFITEYGVFKAHELAEKFCSVRCTGVRS